MKAQIMPRASSATAIPLSLLDSVTLSAAALTVAPALPMATPMPAVWSISMSFSESPKARACSGLSPTASQAARRPTPLLTAAGMTSR